MKTQYDLSLAPLRQEQIDTLLVLTAAVFDEVELGAVIWRLQNMPSLSAFTASVHGQPVAFKIGYAVTSNRYYSWLGGVASGFRRQGHAQTLMKQQHDWAFSQGFDVIGTEVLQDNHAMQMLNERSGFCAAGVRFDRDPARIIYRKVRGT